MTQPAVQSVSPFAFQVGQRVRCVTGEKGRIFGRCLGHEGPRYGIELDDSHRSIMAYESELSPIMSATPLEPA